MRNEIEKKEYQEKIKDLKDLPGLIEKTLLHEVKFFLLIQVNLLSL